MRKLIFVAIAGSTLVAMLAGAGRMAQVYADELLGRYPGAVSTAAEELDVDAAQPGKLTRQGEYQTADSLGVVQHWYATRLRLEPASDNFFGGKCVWLTGSQRIYRFVRTVAVLLCERPDGTQVVVNETFAIGP